MEKISFYKKFDGRLDLGIPHSMSISRNLLRVYAQTRQYSQSHTYSLRTEHFYHKKGKVATLKEYANREFYTVHSPSLHLFTCIPAHCSPVETRMVGFELSSWALQILSEFMSVQNIKLLLQEELMKNTASHRTLQTATIQVTPIVCS